VRKEFPKLEVPSFQSGHEAKCEYWKPAVTFKFLKPEEVPSDIRDFSKSKSFELNKKNRAAAGLLILNPIGPCTVGVTSIDSY
jgi:hypothetical protein